MGATEARAATLWNLTVKDGEVKGGVVRRGCWGRGTPQGG